MRSRLQDETQIRAPTRACGGVRVGDGTSVRCLQHTWYCERTLQHLISKLAQKRNAAVHSRVCGATLPDRYARSFFCISHFFVFFFSFSKAESGKKKSKKSSCKHTDFSSVKIRCLGLGGQVVRNGPFEGDHRFHFSLFSIMLIFRCFLHRRCSMEMWCPDDKGRESWVWVGPLTGGRA